MEKRKYEQLSRRERIEIYRLHADGKSLRSIAGVLEPERIHHQPGAEA